MLIIIIPLKNIEVMLITTQNNSNYVLRGKIPDTLKLGRE